MFYYARIIFHWKQHQWVMFYFVHFSIDHLFLSFHDIFSISVTSSWIVLVGLIAGYLDSLISLSLMFLGCMGVFLMVHLVWSSCLICRISQSGRFSKKWTIYLLCSARLEAEFGEDSGVWQVILVGTKAYWTKMII